MSQQNNTEQKSLPSSVQGDAVMPAYCWSRDLENTYDQPLNAFFVTDWKAAIAEIPASLRFFTGYYMQEKIAGRVPTFDPFVHNIAHANQKGPPIGGIGSGCITRSWQGDFTRWHLLKAGLYQNGVVPVDVFSVCTKRPSEDVRSAIVLNCSKENPRSGVEHWQWWNSKKLHHPKAAGRTPKVFKEMSGKYYSLYPRSWTEYNQPNNKLKLTCRQFSPVIQHNYKESSYPVGSFVWTAENLSDTEPIEVSIMFSFQNGTGSSNDSQGGHRNEAFVEEGVGAGVNMYHTTHNTAQKNGSTTTYDPLMFSIAGKQTPGAKVSICPFFDPVSKTQTERLWREFQQYGSLEDSQARVKAPTAGSASGRKVAGAVCIKVTVEPKQKKEIVFALSWDMPVIRFGPSAHYRRYTKYWGTKGNNSQAIAREALLKHEEWEKAISEWQMPIVRKTSVPNWYKSALFNELYYVVDGGTTWTNGLAIDNPEDPFQQREAQAHHEHFAYLEGHEYNMFNTYDVHFYASHALVANWPQIQLSINRDFAKAVLTEHSEMRTWKSSGMQNLRKKRGCVPHDLGTMDEYPWVLTNAYPLQDTNRWKDLNTEFVLSAYRDYEATQDIQYLKDIWEAVVCVLNYHFQFDKDNDGIIENEGFPDSTYDNWVTTGPSAFSGGLWIAALSCATKMALLLGDEEKAKDYSERLQKGIKSYESKLWNSKGGYYNYDCSPSEYHDSVMSDQLHGHMFLQACGMDTLLDPQRVKSALEKIFALNVKKYSLLTGLRGACNGMRPDGTLDRSFMQSKECWTGTTYCLAACMIFEGMRREAFETAEGIYTTCWDKLGFWFQTPEAYDEKGQYRSLAYMRPLAIWSMQIALDKVKSRRKAAKAASSSSATTTTTA